MNQMYGRKCFLVYTKKTIEFSVSITVVVVDVVLVVVLVVVL